MGSVLVVAAAVATAAAVGAIHKAAPIASSAWDPRVADLVAFVEEARGLTFDHAVPIEFQTQEQYEAEVRAGETELSAEDEAYYATEAATMRALGLAEGDLDLAAANADLFAGGTLAYFDSEADLIVVQGAPAEGPLPADLRAVVVHELTHALQAQHFEAPEGLWSDEWFGWMALLEGDANRIEYLYIETFDDAEYAQWEASIDASMEGVDEGTSEVPVALVELFGAYYTLGEAFTAVIESTGGTEAIDDAFRNPPSTEEQVLDPLTFVDGDEPEDVEPPAIRKRDGEELNVDSLGAVTLLMMLADHVDPHTAIDVIRGWNGGSYASYETDEGQVCVKAAVVADDEVAATQLETVLAAWASAMPAEAGATVERTGTDLSLRSCDPGPDADLAIGDGASRVLVVPTVLAYIQSSQLDEGASPEEARCVAGQVVAAYSIDELMGDDELDDIDRVFSTAERSC